MRGKFHSFIFAGYFIFPAIMLGKVSGLSIPSNAEVDILPKNASQENNNEARQSAVDNIEDAIFGALEIAKLEETTPRPTIATNRPRPDSVTMTPQYKPPFAGMFPPQQSQLPQFPPPFGQFGQFGGNHFPNIGQPGSLLLPWSPLPALTATGSPAQYLGGILGNLGGVADNTLKLVGSSTNAFLGVAGHVSCTLNPMCLNKG